MMSLMVPWGCSRVAKGHRSMDALTDREHGLGHVATTGKWGREFTLILSCRPHPEDKVTPTSSGVTVGRVRRFFKRRSYVNWYCH